MPGSRRREVYRLQGHALSDALRRCGGGIPSPSAYDGEWPKLLCPLCLDWFSFEEMDEDHAPQKAGQSALGEARVVVMTCRQDNRRAGTQYERRAHRLRSALAPVPGWACPVHSRGQIGETGLDVAINNADFDLTNARAAYLIAFATLGHRWALTPRLDRLRRGLRLGDPRGGSADYDVVCAHGLDAIKPFHVYEVVAPVPAVLVWGDGAGVVLPCHTSPPSVAGTVRRPIATRRTALGLVTTFQWQATFRASWPWPAQYTRPGGTVDKAWDDVAAGNLFHYDRCAEPDHHLGHAVALAFDTSS